jgi:Ser/Thr protein kinase RdoA (MazF antagonist)
MDQLIKDRYNDSILQQAIERYGIAKDKIYALDAFESFIFEFERDAQVYILRISHSLRRSEALVLGEVDWINYLAEGGVSVAKAIPSESGKLVEAIEDPLGGTFLVTAFIKAQGQAPWDVWTPKLYESYGEMIGRIHTLSKDYQPTQAAWKRPDWDNDLFEFVERYLPESESIAKQKYKDICRHVNTLAKDRESYGLTHQDAHGNNLFVDEMSHFLHGYVQACPLASAWLKEIPGFLKIREIELYAVLHRDFDVKNIENEWCARFMHNRKSRIEHDVPYIDFDFESLAAQI